MSDVPTLAAKFSSQDLDTLLEAMDEWERVGGEQLNFIKMLENIPDLAFADLPPEMKDAFEKYKQQQMGKKREIEKSRKVRGEKATLLKAKLILLLQRAAANRLAGDGPDGEELELEPPSGPVSPS